MTITHTFSLRKLCLCIGWLLSLSFVACQLEPTITSSSILPSASQSVVPELGSQPPQTAGERMGVLRLTPGSLVLEPYGAKPVLVDVFWNVGHKSLNPQAVECVGRSDVLQWNLTSFSGVSIDSLGQTQIHRQAWVSASVRATLSGHTEQAVVQCHDRSGHMSPDVGVSFWIKPKSSGVLTSAVNAISWQLFDRDVPYVEWAWMWKKSVFTDPHMHMQVLKNDDQPDVVVGWDEAATCRRLQHTCLQSVRAVGRTMDMGSVMGFGSVSDGLQRNVVSFTPAFVLFYASLDFLKAIQTGSYHVKWTSSVQQCGAVHMKVHQSKKALMHIAVAKGASLSANELWFQGEWLNGAAAGLAQWSVSYQEIRCDVYREGGFTKQCTVPVQLFSWKEMTNTLMLKPFIVQRSAQGQIQSVLKLNTLPLDVWVTL